MVACLFGVACVTGERAYQQGDYQRAVLQSVARLRSDPDNEDAARVLRLAYPAAEKWHLENIEAAIQSQDPFRWESVIRSYEQLNQLADAIRGAPAARRIFPDPRPYHGELEAAKRKAAEVRYGMAEQLLESGERHDARRAIDQYETAHRLVPGYRDVSKKLDEAEWSATLKVVVNPTEVATAGLDIAFFENPMHEFIKTYHPSRFVRFFSSADARKLRIREPDQIINLTFIPFPLPELERLEKRGTYEKDDVLVGKTKANPPQEVYGTVKAEVTTHHLTAETGAELDVEILDYDTGEVIRQLSLPGRPTWEASWGSYMGDERAVPDDLWPLMKRSEPDSPTHQELFEDSAGELYDRAIAEIREAYRRVR